MIEAEPIRLGPFLLPVTTLAFALLVWFSAKATDRLLPEDKALWSERFGGALLLYLILYKISPLFTDPVSVLQHPSAILYLSGSPKGAIIAGGITAVYLVAAFRRFQIPLSRGLDAAALIALFTGLGYSFIFQKWGKPTDVPWGIFKGEGVRIHPIHGYRVLLLAAILFWWWRNRKRLRPGETFAWTSLAGGIGLLILSYFDWEPLTVWLNLSWSQWTFIVIAVAGWLGSLVFLQDPKGEIDMNLRNGLIMLVIILAVVGAVWMGGNKGETGDGAPAVKAPEESTAKSEDAPSSSPQKSGAVEQPQQGFRAPNFKLKTLDGKTVELAKNGGKPSFINIWASWCPPCKVEMPYIQEAYEKYGDRINFHMVNMTVTDDLDKMKEYLSSKEFTFPVLLDEKGEVADRYGVISIPMTYAVDEEGVIIHKQMGAMSREQIFDLMEQLAKTK